MATSAEQNFEPFTGNGVVSIWVKNTGTKNHNQTNEQTKDNLKVHETALALLSHKTFVILA